MPPLLDRLRGGVLRHVPGLLLGIVVLGSATAPTAAAAAIAFVQTVGTAGSQAVGTTLTVTVPSAGIQADDTLIVTVAIDPSPGAVSCTDTAGNDYTVDADVQSGSGTSGVRAVILSARVTNALVAGDTITVTQPSVAARTTCVYEFAGISIPDQTASRAGNDTSPSSGFTAPTTQADELLFGGIGMEAKKTDPFTPAAGYTVLVPENSGSGGLSSANVAINAEYRVVAATGAYTADGTILAHPWAAALVTYHAVACGNGIEEPGEQCDDGNLVAGDCCDPSCQFEDPSVVCRDAAGPCDLAETCTGDSGTCPPDEKSTDECRPAADLCDVAESCDGISDDCPPDVFADASLVCRDAVGECDVPDYCTGFDAACPADEKSTDECRPAADVCDVAESCDGIADDCPPDEWAPDADGDGVCDLSDYCPDVSDDSQADSDGDGLGDGCDPCTNIGPVFVEKPLLRLTKLGSGHAKLKLAGVIAVPTDPPIDPATRGVRVILADAGGEALLDAMVPGGAGWRANGSRTVARYRNLLGSEIYAIKISSTRRRPGRLKFQVTAHDVSWTVSESSLPLSGTVVIDAPHASTGQCGEGTFPSSPAASCRFAHAGTGMTCR